MVVAARRVILGCGVAWELLAALLHQDLFSITNAPRHSAIVAISARLSSVLRDGRISPLSFFADEAWWGRVVDMVRSQAYFGELPGLGAHHLIDLIVGNSMLFDYSRERDRGAVDRVLAGRPGKLLYHIAWVRWGLSNAITIAKFRDISAWPTWWVITGGEWWLFNHAKGFACAYFLLRVLGGGLPGSSWIRAAAPRICATCDSHDVAYL